MYSKNVSNCAPQIPRNSLNTSFVGILYVTSHINNVSFHTAVISYTNI